jgi:drug/metabolite transporter (DMT)-like permease
VSQSPPLRGLLLVAGAATLWGTWGVILRPMGLPSTVTSALVMLLVGVTGLPLVLAAKPARWDRTTVLLLLANSAFDAINVATFFGALERTSLAIAVLTHYAAPILVALAAPRIDGVRTRGAPLAALLATAGLALVLEPWKGAADGVVVGASLGLISAVAYAANVFVVGRLTRRIGPARCIAYHALIAGVVLLPLGVRDLDLVTTTQLVQLTGASLVLGTVAGVMYITGLALVGSARAGVLAFLEPLVAVICGWVAFGEALGPIGLAGGAMVLGAGVWVATSR